jgi:hypothetical protein
MGVAFSCLMWFSPLLKQVHLYDTLVEPFKVMTWVSIKVALIE